MDISGLDIKKFRESKGWSQTKLAETVGVSFRTIQNYEAGGKIPKSKHAIFHSLFNEDSEPAFKIQGSDNNKNLTKANAIWVEYDSFKLVPLINHRAQAGFLSGYGDDEYLNELPKVPWEVDKEYKGQYLCFEVSGDSMESDTEPRDSILDGDLLLCREVQRQHWKNRLHINKWDFVIAHKTEGILCKRIINHDTANGQLTLHSLNPYYEDIKVSMDDLIAIFNIVDVKRSRRR